MFHDQAMPEQWIIRVQGKEYGPADLDTLRDWKADGRVLPANPARPVDVDPTGVAGFAKEAVWKTAADIPGLFPVQSPVHVGVEARVSRAADTAATTPSTAPGRTTLVAALRSWLSLHPGSLPSCSRSACLPFRFGCSVAFSSTCFSGSNSPCSKMRPRPMLCAKAEILRGADVIFPGINDHSGAARLSSLS